MAEVKLKNLLRLYKLRNKFDAVILAVHSCLVERGFRCINSGEEVSYHIYVDNDKNKSIQSKLVFPQNGPNFILRSAIS